MASPRPLERERPQDRERSSPKAPRRPESSRTAGPFERLAQKAAGFSGSTSALLGAFAVVVLFT